MILSAKLYIVSTPIGNLEDITKRSLLVLEKIDYIACEDTRVTKRLLKHYDINKKLIVYNDYNENSKKDYLLNLLLQGNDIALVSDAGTPCISDPGYRLVNLAHKNNIQVLTIPGPCSAISAISISGLPTDNFYFQGFLPKKKGRKTRFIFLSNLNCSVILFESPKRILKTLNDINLYMGDRTVSICRELTKIYEEVIIDKVDNILKNLNNLTLKGEFVIVIAKEGYEYNE